jgi:L-alanine-DL-glutamate epimerase-like enolase superfamily enzyme
MAGVTSAGAAMGGDQMVAAGEAARIVAVEAVLYRVPLAEALVDAGHGLHTHFELVTCRIVCADGVEGIGYTYTGGTGGGAIRALLREDIAPLLKGADAHDVEALAARMRATLHYLGVGGICGFAIAAADIALWDIRCKRLGKPLWQVAGGTDPAVRCYRGLIDLGYSDDQLLERVAAEFAAGHTGIKLKVGRPDIATDIRRVRAVRELIGTDRALMADANYSWDAPAAIAFARGVEDMNLAWFEEPVAHDDLDAYASVAAATAIPLASGENLRTPAEFGQAIAHHAIAVLQPDASNIGGITPWLDVARRAAAAGKPVASHGMHELHVSLMAAIPNAGPLEIHSFPIDAYTTNPTTVTNGKTAAPNSPGSGVSFNTQRLKPHKIG